MPEDKDADLAAVDRVIALLSERFDSVQVFASRYDGEGVGTVNVSKGSGNWFARRGQVQDWLIKENEGSRENVRQTSDGQD